MYELRQSFERAAAAAGFVVPSASEGFWRRDDFETGLDSVFSVSGGGTHTYDTDAVNHPGVVTQTVAALSSSARILTRDSASNITFSGGEIYIEGLSKIPTLSNATDNVVLRLGFGDNTGTGDHVDGAYLEYDFATHGHHRLMLCAANNSVRTKVDTGVTVVADTWFRWRITVNAAGTLVSCTVDGVAGSNTVSTNIPTTAARGTVPMIQSVKQLGTGTLTTEHDYYEVYQTFTTTR